VTLDVRVPPLERSQRRLFYAWYNLYMNEKHTTAKDFFIHLAAVIALYVSVISLINLLFAIINSAFPDAISYYPSGDSYTVRWTISSLVILFPLYIYLVKTISKDLIKNTFKKDLWIRKWSRYLTLFLTGAAIVVDLIVLINTFLGGEISTRFILKVVAVLVIAGFTFYAYAKDAHKNINVLTGIAAVLVVASIVGGFFTVGSPAKQRALQFDAQRINDLSSIQSYVTQYWQTKGSLPVVLADINDTLDTYGMSLTDPRTDTAYEYTVTGPEAFTLCATFETSSDRDSSYIKPGYNWGHEEGRVCFDRKVDTNLYKAFPVAAPSEMR